MRITINPTLDMETMTWLPAETYEYTGLVMLCCSSADPDEKENEDATLAMTKTLQADYSISFGKNQAILNNLTTALNAQIAKPQGYSTPELDALRTGAMDTTSRQFSEARGAAGASAARYGGDVASGVTGQLMGGIDAAEASTESNEQNTIAISNAERQQQNYWAGISALGNTAAAYNPTGYAGAASSSSNATTNAANAVLSEEQAGWQDVGGMMSGIAGMGMAAGSAMTGVGKMEGN
jgi:hypothetical protein